MQLFPFYEAVGVNKLEWIVTYVAARVCIMARKANRVFACPLGDCCVIPALHIVLQSRGIVLRTCSEAEEEINGRIRFTD
jgi:hypothetical protein